ncbi:MAG TPA: DUF3536 domain-containing protein [Candidatus Limnocylindrales bacterium]|nr:DUF3536 domain-containing protein [Candidatus Limnocylindrales bacterium]
MIESPRGRLVVHGHFYQPLRVDPFSGQIPADPAAAPFHDWNARIDAESYRPIGERGTLSRMSFNVGATLAVWLATAAPETLRRFAAGDRWSDMGDVGADVPPDRGNAMAQAFHHAILPLASASDRRTEIRWGLREFVLRFGHRAEGMWLPETAVDLPTLRALAEEGIRYTILAPWQVGDPNLDNRRPYRVELGGGRSIVVALYDAGLSSAVSFEPAATADADRFARERVATRLTGTPFPDGEPGLVLIATDGELYGHHQPFRDLFLHRLVAPGPGVPDRGFDVAQLATALLGPPEPAYRVARIAERTSWSCHHGVARWSTECPDAVDGRWKGPLRAALDRLAGAIDAVTEEVFARLPASPDRIAARDAFVDVVVGVEPESAFAARWLGDDASATDRGAFLDLLDAQRWRLAMFASDGWFWDDPVRPETRQNLRCAARAVRIVDVIAGTRLERALVADLGLFVSPGQGLDGAAIYRAALSEVGQPGPAA